MAAPLTEIRTRALHGVRWRVRALRRRLTQPLVSVVVPVYNVQTYVEECLTSLLAQTYRRLQVIVVDDGGSDDSMAIVSRVTAGDRRVRIISQPNAGLGAARNTGTRAAKGTYLRFVDSDDVLPPDSIAVLVRSLERTGSDFAVGNLRRMTSAKDWVPAWAKEVHRVDRLGIGLDALPDVLKDPFAHNKLFRTDFFHRVVQGFPEGVLYEDQEPTARAYVAGRFDVLSTVVYHWRVREDGTSITQQKSDPVDLRHRLEVKDRVGHIMGAGASREVAEHWLAKAIGFDLRPYYEQVPRTDLDFWEQLRAGVARFAAQLDLAVWQQVPMIDRLLALAVVAGHRSDVIALLTKREEYGWQLPGTAADGVVSLDPGYLTGLQLQLEPGLLRFADADLLVRSQVEAVTWSGSTLSVEAYAHLRNTDLTTTPHTTEVELVSDVTAEVRPLVVTPRDAPQVDTESGDSWNSFAGSAFTATVDLADWPRTPGETWRLRVRLVTGGVRREHVLTSLDRRRAIAQLPVGRWQPGVGRWVLQHDGQLGLGVKLDPVGPPLLAAVSVHGDDVELELAEPGPAALVVDCSTTRRRLRVPMLDADADADADRTRFRVTLPPVPLELRDQPLDWRVRAETADGTARLVWPGTTAALGAVSPANAVVVPVCSREGTLRLRQHAWTATVEQVALVGAEGTDPEVVVVEGRLSFVPGATWTGCLVGDDHRRTPVETVQVAQDGAFTLSLPLVTDGGLEIAWGGFELEVTCAEPDGPVLTRRIGATETLVAQFPLELETRRRALACTRSGTGGLRVRPRRPHRDDERGRLAQRRIHDSFRDPGPVAVEPWWFVFECFAGRNVADSVLALYGELRHRYPQAEFFWSVAELTTPVPEGAHALPRYTWAWADTVQRATYLVNNANFPHYFRKREHQTYLQTWHGTPLKKIGQDMPLTNLSLSYRASMVRETLAWDVLLAQGPFAAEVLPRAFGYTGRVVDAGYPRNDVLVEGDTTRKSVRAELGLDDDEHVVLYAPTWRDDVRNANGQYELVSFLDFDAAAARLGEVRFLLRGHTNTVSAGYSSDAVLDVSGHPDVNDLMLAADALITDYSSVMFDFCVTGKPMYFLVPDLERYGSATRGFYFDLPEAAPGPVCLTDTELVDALAQRQGYDEVYRERYAAFVRRFAPYDDGHATERVVDAVWGPREPKDSPAADGG